MYNDIVFIDENLINICDMSEYIIGKKYTKKTVKNNKNNDIERFVIKIPRKEIKEMLENKGISLEHIEYKLNLYLNNKKDELKSSEWMFDEVTKNEKIKFIDNYKEISNWQNELKVLFERKAKPVDFGIFLFDFEYEDLIFKEVKSENELQKYLLKEESDLFDEYNLEVLYNIPFVNKNELLFIALIMFAEIEEVIIDITERLNNRIQKVNSTKNIFKNTLYYHRFKNEGNQLLNNLEKYKNDEMINKLFVVYLVTIFESYIKNIIKIAVNNNKTFMRRMIEKDDNCLKKGTKIESKKIFEEISNLSKKINNFIDSASFQSVETIINYLANIFQINSMNDKEKAKEFKESYSKLIEIRNNIVHSNGYSKKGDKVSICDIDIRTYYGIIHEKVKEVDANVFISIIE